MGDSPRWPVRPARTDDIPSLVRMMVGETPWRELEYDAERCESLLSAYLSEVQVAVAPDDQPVGFLRWNPQWFLGQPYLHLLAVAPQQRRRRVGTALIGWLEHKVFEERRYANLFLCVSAFNEPARTFYRRIGYTEVGPLTDYVRAGLDEVLLRKTSRPLLATREDRTP